MKNQENKVSSIKIWSNIIFVIKRLFSINKALFFVRIPLLFLQAFSPIVSILFLRAILNELTGQREIKIILAYIIGFFATSFLMTILNRFLSACDKKQLEKTSYSFHFMLGKALSEIPFSDIEQPRIRDFISLASTSNSFSAVIEAITGLFNAIINTIAYGSIVFFLHPVMLLLIVSVIAIQIFIQKLKRNRAYLWRVSRQPLARKASYTLMLLGGLKYGKEVRVNNLQDCFLNKGEEQFSGTWRKTGIRMNAEGQLLLFIMELSKILQKLFIYFLLAWKVIFRNMLIGDFSMYLSGTDQLTNSLSGLIGCYSNLMTYGMFANEFRYCVEVSERDIKISDKNFHEVDGDLSIEFKNVTFRYPNTETDVLKNVSFKLNYGETLSIVGVNGSGKTTLVKLLCDFYKPTEGDIFIGGVNTKNLSNEECRKLLGVVFQDFQLFSFSVRENISLTLNSDENKVQQSVADSGLVSKILSLKQGLSTNVGKMFDESGVEFSGGESQKLAIARAIYKDAPILILDEPTAALDPIAEYEIYSKFHKLSKEKTAIYISHRLSSTRFTDKIAVFSEGKLEEFGTHEELVSVPNGLYSQLYQMQAKNYI